VKVLICGSRNWDYPNQVSLVIGKLPEDTVVIHGDARGADRTAGAYAVLRGLEVRAYPYLKEFGRRGGPIRNQQMLDLEHPDLVIYFTVDPDNPTRGTADMIRRAHKAEIPVIHWRAFLND
jgi:hypothetical protein